MKASAILPSPELDRKILEYVLAVTDRARAWWSTRPENGTEVSRRDELTQYRLRMEGRRSVAELYHDAKTEPFDGASNVGVGIEAVFAEFLIPLLIANTHDLEPMLQAKVLGTHQVHDDLTTFHDSYHRYEVPDKRELLETSTRHLLTVGSDYHKWSYGRLWRQTDAELPVWQNPLDGQPLMSMDQGLGRPMPRPADPNTPPEAWPKDPMTGRPLEIISLKAVQPVLKREGPELSLRPVEAITFPDAEQRADPDVWEFLSDDFEVTAYWLLGREGDPFLGKLKLEALWKWLGLDPNELHRDPLKLAQTLKPIKLRAFHGKYPAAADGRPVEITALIAPEAKLNLGWRPSPFPRRPYFNRQVWASGTSPIGKGIPETLFGLRSAMDALLNQDIDAGNLYNHPPLLLSDMAMLEDEDYESTGPGATWIMRDINGAKFLPSALGARDPVALLNWLISNGMRLWGVTDLTLNSPSNALSSTPLTARGTHDILNTGSIKFGHLTKRLADTDTKEYQYVHECFRAMLANPKRVSVNGHPQPLDPAQREMYFADGVGIVAVGNGISTNPIMRQNSLGQFIVAAVTAQNPFLIGDLEVYKQLTDQWAASFGIDVTTKDPQLLQQIKMFQEIMQTPLGQQLLPHVMQQIAIQTVATQGQAPGAPPTPQGAPTNGTAASVPAR